MVVPYEAEALGRAIRRRREQMRPSMSQAKLGEEAGYGTGAAVSISRIETGVTRPGPARLAGIAGALGTTVEDLEAEAERIFVVTPGGQVGAAAGESVADDAQRTLKERLKILREGIRERSTQVNDRLERLEVAHDGARDRFFMPFVDCAGRITGAPEPPPPDPFVGDSGASAQEQAHFRIASASSGFARVVAGGLTGGVAGAAVGGSAAYATFVAASTFGTASTGAAISGLSGVAATNAAMAALGGGSLAAGGAGIAGGAAVLAGIVAIPMAILAVGGVVWMVRRTRRQQEELRLQLVVAEKKYRDTQQGFDKLVDALDQSIRILDYVGTYASHALGRWEQRLGQARTPTAWARMTDDDRQRYRDFSSIAACQATVVTIDMTNYLTLDPEPLEEFASVTDEVLAQSWRTITSLV